jgi:hypothetical protein
MSRVINPDVAPGKVVQLADGVYWVGALDPDLRTFDIILSTAKEPLIKSKNYECNGISAAHPLITLMDALRQKLKSGAPYQT